MARKLPWEDQTSPVYVAIDTKQRKSWVTVYAWFCVAVLIFCAFVTKYHLVCGLLSVFLAFGIITKRTTAVSERGLENYIDAGLFDSNDVWTWDDIEYLTFENNPAVPDTTLLFFTRGPRTRKGFFKDADAEKIKIMARVRKITVYDGNEYRAEAKAYNASQKRGKKRKRQ